MKKTINIELLSSENHLEYLSFLSTRLERFSSMAYKIEDSLANEINETSYDNDVKFIIAITQANEILIIRLTDKVFFTYSGNNPIINEFLWSKGLFSLKS